MSACGRHVGSRRGPPSGLLVAVVVAGVLVSPLGHVSASGGGGDEDIAFHVVFSSAILGGVSHDDAKASLQVWGTRLARSQQRQTHVTAEIVDDMDVLRDRLRTGSVDYYAVRVDEYFDLERLLPKGMSPGILFLGRREGDVAERYVVITHRDSGLATLAAMRGRSLLMIEGSRRGLAPLWLDTVLLDAGLPNAAQHFGSIAAADKPARVVLPVFFRQRDVGVVPERALATVTEMNPQVGRDLVVVARSEPIVGAVTALRADYGPAQERERVLSSILSTAADPRAQQILAIFGMETVVKAAPEDLATARALVERHARLVTKAVVRRAP